MNRWFYKTIDLPDTPSHWQAEFDRLGDDGWELIQIIETAISKQAVFKKQETIPEPLKSDANHWINQWI